MQDSENTLDIIEDLQKKLKESERIREQLQQENERLKIKVSLLEDDGR
jgi:hypothetical protein